MSEEEKVRRREYSREYNREYGLEHYHSVSGRIPVDVFAAFMRECRRRGTRPYRVVNACIASLLRDGAEGQAEHVTEFIERALGHGVPLYPAEQLVGRRPESRKNISGNRK